MFFRLASSCLRVSTVFGGWVFVLHLCRSTALFRLIGSRRNAESFHVHLMSSTPMLPWLEHELDYLLAGQVVAVGRNRVPRHEDVVIDLLLARDGRIISLDVAIEPLLRCRIGHDAAVDDAASHRDLA